jgi:Phosphotransferase enzyme family
MHDETTSQTHDHTIARARESAPNLPDDDFLPRLAEALDSEAMAPRFQRELFGHGLAHPEIDDPHYLVESCHIERTRYQPGKRCAIGYRLVIRDLQTGKAHDHYLCGRVFEPGASSERFAKYRRQPLETPLIGPPLLHIEELEMILWSFPNDRRLSALPILVDESRLAKEIVPELVRNWWGEGWSITELSSSIASYVHERRCSVRLALRLRYDATGESQFWNVYGKTSEAESGDAIDRAARKLWDSQARQLGAFDMARPLGSWSDSRIFWQQEVPGRPLARWREARLNAGQFSGAGAAVAELHHSLLDGASAVTLTDVIHRLHERADMICRAWPERRSEISPIMVRLIEAAPRLNQDVLVTVHGDLHAENIVIDQDRISLIDLDEAVSGPPMHDIGHFVAYLLWDGSLAGHSTTELGAAIVAFVQSYRSRTAWPAPDVEIAWYAAAALISEKIFRCVTLMQTGNERHLARFLELADRLSRGDVTALGLEGAASVASATSKVARCRGG